MQKMKSPSKPSSGSSSSGSSNSTVNAAICQQTAYECLHNKMSSVEMKTQAMWQSIQEEVENLPDNEDYNQPAVPLHLTQKILQEEADFMGFPSSTSSLSGQQVMDGPHLDTADKSACAALSKLCEMFVLEFTHRATHMRENNATLTKEDFKNVIKTTEIYDLFLDHLNR